MKTASSRPGTIRTTPSGAWRSSAASGRRSGLNPRRGRGTPPPTCAYTASVLLPNAASCLSAEDALELLGAGLDGGRGVRGLDRLGERVDDDVLRARQRGLLV